MQFDFLLCSERSGSNLITRLIGAHSQVCAPATTHLFRMFAASRTSDSSYDPLDDDTWWATCQDASDLFDAKLGDWHLQLSTEQLAREVTVRSSRALLRWIYEREAIALAKRQVFVKEIELFRFWEWMEASFPTARYVAMVRDPRDMALSWKRAAALRGGVVRAAQVWLRDQTRLRPIIAALRQSGRVVELTYENLVTQPAAELQRVMPLLGLTYEPQQLEYHQQDATTSLAQSAAEYRNLQQPILTQNTGKFRDGLSPDEIAYIERLCGDAMEHVGYHVCDKQVSATESLESLEARLLPLEPHTKPAYAQVSQRERQTRARWVTVCDRIRARQDATLASLQEERLP
jgi:hypothetical protein